MIKVPNPQIAAAYSRLKKTNANTKHARINETTGEPKLVRILIKTVKCSLVNEKTID